MHFWVHFVEKKDLLYIYIYVEVFGFDVYVWVKTLCGFVIILCLEKRI